MAKPYVPPSPAKSRRRAITALIVAVLLFAAGFIYIALPASELFLPGHRAGESTHNMTAGFFCMLGAFFALVIAGLLMPKGHKEDAPWRRTPRLREEDLPPGSIHVIPARPLDRVE
ncbi:MAG: hypothetical protein ACYCO3_11035 [Mycobacteriales bacterium]